MTHFSSENIDKLATALSVAQGQISAAVMDKNNPFFRSKYSSLNAFWDACRKPLSENGLSLSQCTSVEGENLIMTTLLLHSSGQWLKSFFPVCNTKSTIQQTGSCLSYARRYSLAAIVGLSCDEDDDGNAGNNAAPVAQKKQQEPPLAKVECISDDQVNHLLSLLQACAPGFVKDVFNPKLQSFKLNSIDEIPVPMYKNVEAFIIKSRDEFLSQSSLNDLTN